MSVRKCAPSEDSDQIAHSRSLIRIFAGRILDSQWCQVSSCIQGRLWSDCAEGHADLNAQRAHISKDTFSYVGSHIMAELLSCYVSLLISCQHLISLGKICFSLITYYWPNYSDLMKSMTVANNTFPLKLLKALTIAISYILLPKWLPHRTDRPVQSV